MLNEIVIFGKVQEVQLNEPLCISNREYIPVLINISSFNSNENINLIRLLIRLDLFDLYYSQIKIDDEIIAKGILKNRYYGDSKLSKKVETNVFVREIFKASYYIKENRNNGY